MEGVIRRAVEAGLEDCFDDRAGTCTFADLKLENSLKGARTSQKKALTHKKPKLKIAISDARVRLLIWRFHTMGTGKTAKVTSVTMFTTGLVSWAQELDLAWELHTTVEEPNVRECLFRVAFCCRCKSQVPGGLHWDTSKDKCARTSQCE